MRLSVSADGLLKPVFGSLFHLKAADESEPLMLDTKPPPLVIPELTLTVLIVSKLPPALMAPPMLSTEEIVVEPLIASAVPVAFEKNVVPSVEDAE